MALHCPTPLPDAPGSRALRKPEAAPPSALWEPPAHQVSLAAPLLISSPCPCNLHQRTRRYLRTCAQRGIVSVGAAWDNPLSMLSDFSTPISSGQACGRALHWLAGLPRTVLEAGSPASRPRRETCAGTEPTQPLPQRQPVLGPPSQSAGVVPRPHRCVQVGAAHGNASARPVMRIIVAVLWMAEDASKRTPCLAVGLSQVRRTVLAVALPPNHRMTGSAKASRTSEHFRTTPHRQSPFVIHRVPMCARQGTASPAAHAVVCWDQEEGVCADGTLLRQRGVDVTKHVFSLLPGST